MPVKGRLILLIVVSVSFYMFYAHVGAGQSDNVSVVDLPVVDTQLIFELVPPAGAWTLQALEGQYGEPEVKQIFASEGYRLEVAYKLQDENVILDFTLRREDGNNFQLRRYAATWAISMLDFFAIWNANTLPWVNNIVRAYLLDPFIDITGPNYGIPYMLAATEDGRNRLAVGLISQDRIARLTGEPDINTWTYRLAIEPHRRGKFTELKEQFFISRKRISWFDITKEYARIVDQASGFEPVPRPDKVYEPIYDPWYWAGSDINSKLVWELALKCREVGIKTYMFDLGWDGEPAGAGNYIPSYNRFPDFEGLLDRMRNELGLNIELWVSQYVLTRESMFYPAMYNAVAYVGQGADKQESDYLCPRVFTTHRHISDLFARIMRDYRPDALWLDFQEEIPRLCTADHRHNYSSFASGYRDAQALTRDTILKHNPEAFIQFRWPYANLFNKPYATTWQPYDSPEEFDGMRLQAMNLRPFSEGVIIATDEMYWSPRLDNVTVAKFIATVIMTGVPAFGLDLTREPQSHIEILKAWLRFYQQHKWDLAHGEFRPFGSFQWPDQKIESESAAFIYLRSGLSTELNLDREPEQIYIVNATDSDKVELRIKGLTPGTYDMRVLNHLLNPTRTATMEFGETFDLNMAIPQGGMVALFKRT